MQISEEPKTPLHRAYKHYICMPDLSKLINFKDINIIILGKEKLYH